MQVVETAVLVGFKLVDIPRPSWDGSCWMTFHGKTALVEVAGIEPASESLQRKETTCLSGSSRFRRAAFEPARTPHD